MRIYFSGGSPIPEANLRDPPPDIMLSMFVDASNGEPRSRLRKILDIRTKAKALKLKKGKPDATRKAKPPVERKTPR